MEKKLFVVDLDGTLLRDDKSLAGADRDALARLRDMGIVTAIATGRSNYSFQKITDDLGWNEPENPLPVDYVIFSTGAGIMDFPACTILNKYSLNEDDVIVISDAFNGCNLDYMIHRSIPDTKHFIYSYCTGENSDFETRLDIYKEHGAVLTTENLAGFGEATEVLCIVDESAGDQVARQLSAVLSQYSVIKATSPLDKRSLWIEIFAKEVSKSKAVSWLSKKIGASQANVCAVGNDYNDVDLLDWAGQGYLVSNGPGALQADYTIVASNNEGGVAEAALRWIQGLASAILIKNEIIKDGEL
jgi:Cof subfamily protein (haloacid dehalogenase superfamily)